MDFLREKPVEPSTMPDTYDMLNKYMWVILT